MPALFDEANKLRRLTVEVMRRLAEDGIGTVLADFPGCNESRRPLTAQTLEGWRQAALAASDHFGASHVLTMRGGALLAPADMPGWNYAPIAGRQVLRPMLRARTLSAREAGAEETIRDLELLGRSDGIELAGWTLGRALFCALETATLPDESAQMRIEQDMIGGSGLWMRAEPGESRDQADALAAAIAQGIPAQ
ncbi:hypothetical protein [Pelagerythrobacter marensis]|uniref:Uncharacterized protein n=1 Tax=Pelagerythrobacter marensis TaxID=543877 RepID=A0A0G3X888_9SPHN|nr:hypothetical protein [Pelagerythrobacter marensis]AKM07417.1 hypothetical protein AM2010_1344 [Pelagerythrobacter marensis]